MISPRTLPRPTTTDRYWLVALVALHLFILWLRVGPLLLHPSQYLFTTGGDGLKSYFALLYYLQADHGMQFTGMHYPYGELLLFTDGFPLLAWILKAWKNLFGLSLNDAIGAFNLTVLLSSVPATPLVYTLIRRGRVAPWFSALSALCIVFLSPQFHRIGGHYTLAIPVVVPLLWYVQLRVTEAATLPARVWWVAAYTLTTVLLALIHPYYLLHALLLPAATALVLLVQQAASRQPRWWHMPAWLLATGLLPVVLFQGWISWLDPISDRPINPYGFFVYHSSPAAVFGPATEPFKSVFRFIFRTGDPAFEGVAYVGLPVVLGLLLWVARVGWHLVHRHWRRVLRPTLPHFLQPTVWAAGLVLAFAMCLPFKIPGFEPLLDWLPALKQFRSLGRFTWIFYYVAAVLAAVQFWQLYRFLRQQGAGRVGQLILGLVLLIWGLEAKYQLEAITRPLLANRVATTFLQPGNNYAELLARAGHYPDQYQAILPLPYFSLGSEKFDLSGIIDVSAAESFRAALSLNRPVAATMMSRTSTEQTLRLLELFSSDLTPKSWPGQLPSQQPLLVVVSRRDALRPAEQALLRRGAKLLTETPLVQLYELPLSAFATQRPAAERAWFTAHQAELLREGELWRTAPGPAVIWRSFQEKTAPSGVSFTRPGAAHAAKGMLPIFDGPLPGATDTTTYELSIWAHAKTSDWLPYISYRQLTPEGQELERLDLSLKESTEIHGDWARFSLPIRLRNPANRVVVEMGGADIVVDDLLIRPRSTHVYWLDALQQPVLDGFPLAK